MSDKNNELLEIADKADLEITTNAVLGEIRAKIAAKIGGNGSENDGLDKALAIIDDYIREGKDCTGCKWYGFTCECPVHCTQDTKIAWESATKESEGKG